MRPMLSRLDKFKPDRAAAVPKHDRLAIFYHCCRMKLKTARHEPIRFTKYNSRLTLFAGTRSRIALDTGAQRAQILLELRHVAATPILLMQTIAENRRRCVLARGEG